MTYDGLDGGYCGHAIYLALPQDIYFDIVENKHLWEGEIREGINKFNNISDEFIAAVFIELEVSEVDVDWREDSGLLKLATRHPHQSPTRDMTSIWKAGYLRLFVSHKAEYKEHAFKLKLELNDYGIDAFVAHEDIEPTKVWLREIENALHSCDIMVALMTEQFSESNWTDQEIGAAFGRNIQVIPVKVGKDPYGLIGKYQALQGLGKNSEVLSSEIFDLLWSKPLIKEILVDALITRFENSESFSRSKKLIKHIKRIETASPNQVERLRNSLSKNYQISAAIGVPQALAGLLTRLQAPAT